MMARVGSVLAVLGAVAGCGSSTKSDAQLQAAIVDKIHTNVLSTLKVLSQAALDLQAAAPTPPDRGWDATQDATAIGAMTGAWNAMRGAWEGVEGVVPDDLDAALDKRYEELLVPLGSTGDPDPFDGVGVIGMHAVERILYANTIPAAVVALESTFVGYSPAAWPATAEQASEFHTELCARLVADTQMLITRWGAPGVIDAPGAYAGLEALMSAQEEKMNLAAVHLEESRYAQRTLGDLRENLSGTRSFYNVFVPWLDTKLDGPTSDDRVQTTFTRLEETYDTVMGDALPPPPADWSTTPSSADQQTPFGELFAAVRQEVNPAVPGSAVDEMNRVARLLGLPELPQTN